MTKDHNDTVRHVPDPERSTAAKGRKPPPNWAAKYRDASDRVAKLEEALAIASRNQQDLLRQLMASGARLALQSGIVVAQAAVIDHLTRPWYSRDKQGLRHAQAKLTAAQRDWNEAVRREQESVRLRGQDTPDQPGNIAGLQQRPTGAFVGSAKNLADLQAKRPPFNSPG